MHLKSNLGGIEKAIVKREEGARQLLTHVTEMEKLYSTEARIVTVIAGDFNTDSTDPRFATERTFEHLQEYGFHWAWEAVPLNERVDGTERRALSSTRASMASLFAARRLFRLKSFRSPVLAIICQSSFNNQHAIKYQMGSVL